MTNITPTDLQARMQNLVRWMASSSPKTTEQDAWFCEAQDIVSKLDPDPDVLAVREILADSLHDNGSRQYRDGAADSAPHFQRALAAYKRIKADPA